MLKIFILFSVILVISAENNIRNDIFSDKLVNLRDIQNTEKTYIHIAMIITIGKSRNISQLITKITRNLKEMMWSIFKSSRSKTPLHLIIITDKNTIPIIKETIKNILGKFLSEKIIHQYLTGTLPKIQVEFASLLSITDKYRDHIDQMKMLFGYHDPEEKFVITEDVVLVENKKYTHDLFFIAPFYHREVPEMINRLIVLDIDLEFKIDVLELYKQFNQFGPLEMIGIANDLSPHYFASSGDYRSRNPETLVGSPGRYQGFNSGVTLYNLKKMRYSPAYQQEVQVDRMKDLAVKYMFAGTVGDQDWLTLLGWERPEMFHLLPCHYNVQIHEGYKNTEFAQFWDNYRNCSEPSHPDTKIIHKNGSW